MLWMFYLLDSPFSKSFHHFGVEVVLTGLVSAAQAGDSEGAEAALQPAWAALDSNMHKTSAAAAPEITAVAYSGNFCNGSCSPAQPRPPEAAALGAAVACSGNGYVACSGSAAHHTGCPFLMRFTAAWVYVAMATAGVSLLEKQRRYTEACDVIRQLLGALALQTLVTNAQMLFRSCRVNIFL